MGSGALAFAARPKPPALQAHLAEASAPEPIARETATPVPSPTATAVPMPTLVPTAAPIATPVPVPTAVLVAAAHQAQAEPPVVEWGALVAGVFGVAGAVALALKRLLARPSS
jgi:mannan endo-1,4-beta-mannosidase